MSATDPQKRGPEFSGPLLLPNRSGLPSEIAYLRSRYPKPQWRAHRNFGEMTAFWLKVHDALRGWGANLKRMTHDFREGRLDAASFRQQFAPYLGHFLQHLDGHHQIEDGHYFPRFRALDTRMIAGFDLLENDHAIIHDRLLDTATSGQALIAALATGDTAARRVAAAYTDNADRLLDYLLRHLADEEDLVVPGILEHTERKITA
jgi:hemerythrin-like domain-containing protein